AIGDAPADSAKAEKPKDEPKADQKEEKAEAKSEVAPKAPSSSSDAKPAPEPLPAPKTDGKRIFASPLARRLAKEAGIDLSAVSGSGPKGRVVKADIEKA